MNGLRGPTVRHRVARVAGYERDPALHLHQVWMDNPALVLLYKNYHVTLEIVQVRIENCLRQRWNDN